MNYFSFNRVPDYGIHLFTGSIGSGTVNLMIKKARKLCKKYPQLCVFTNLELYNFPEHTKIYSYNDFNDIYYAPANSLFILDDNAFLSLNQFPTIVLKHFAQSRLRRHIIMGSVQFPHQVNSNLINLASTVYKCVFFLGYPFHYKLEVY